MNLDYTHDEIGMLLGMSRSHVTNLLRLLNGWTNPTLDETRAFKRRPRKIIGRIAHTKSNIGLLIMRLKKNGQWEHWMMQ